MSDLWTAASIDAEQELRLRLVTSARVGVQSVWSFLASADDEADYANRLAMCAERIEAAVADATVTDPEQFVAVRDQVVADLRGEFDVLAAQRKAERFTAAEPDARARVTAELARREANEMDDEGEYVSSCPACGNPIDYCRGHGPSGDPTGHAILEAHDNGDHTRCHPEGCDQAGQREGSFRDAALQVEAVAWARRHYEDLASTIAAHPERQQLADHFAKALGGTNPNYREEQFRSAASTEGYKVRGGTGTASYSKGHFQRIADTIKSYPGDKAGVASHFAQHLAGTNPRFDQAKFLKAATGSLQTEALYENKGKPIDRGSHPWTLSEHDEDWIGNFTDKALDEAHHFWTSDEGRKAQPNLPGYSDEMVKHITNERARRHGARRTAAEGGERAAKVTGGARDLAQVQAYMPSNYTASERDGTIWISGHDSAGWTLDGYVIPRLASGLIFAEEVSSEGQGETWASLHTAADHPDTYVHAFRTFMGLPPSKSDKPVCNAELSDAYDFAPGHRPVCPNCEAIMNAHKVSSLQVVGMRRDDFKKGIKVTSPYADVPHYFLPNQGSKPEPHQIGTVAEEPDNEGWANVEFPEPPEGADHGSSGFKGRRRLLLNHERVNLHDNMTTGSLTGRADPFASDADRRTEATVHTAGIPELDQAVEEFARGDGTTIKEGDRIGSYTVMDVGTHVIAFQGDDGYSAFVQIPFVDERGKSLPSHQRAMDELESRGSLHEATGPLCDACHKPMSPIEASMGSFPIHMECVRARHRAAQDGRCHCGRERVPGEEIHKGGYTVRVDGETKNRGGRSWIPCDRCLGTIKQTSSLRTSAKDDDPYHNPDVRVRPAHPRQFGNSVHAGGTNRYKANKAWAIYHHGQHTDHYVASTDIGKTIVDSTGRMKTSWHAGVGPGDLARMHINLRGPLNKQSLLDGRRVTIGTVAHEDNKPHGAHDDSGNHADGTSGGGGGADGKPPFPPTDDAQQPAAGEDGGDPAADPAAALTPGQEVTVNYTMPDGTSGTCPATVQTSDGQTATFSYENGTFTVTQKNGAWADSAGATFTFGGGDGGDEEEPEEDPAKDAPPKDSGDKPGDSDPEKKKDAKESSLHTAGEATPNSSGIIGWVNMADNDGFPCHTFKPYRKGGRTCQHCNLPLYKAVHAETAESEARRGRGTTSSQREAAKGRYVLRHDKYGDSYHHQTIELARRERDHPETVPAGEWYIWDRHEKRRVGDDETDQHTAAGGNQYMPGQNPYSVGTPPPGPSSAGQPMPGQQPQQAPAPEAVEPKTTHPRAVPSGGAQPMGTPDTSGAAPGAGSMGA